MGVRDGAGVWRPPRSQRWRGRASESAERGLWAVCLLVRRRGRSRAAAAGGAAAPRTQGMPLLAGRPPGPRSSRRPSGRAFATEKRGLCTGGTRLQTRRRLLGFQNLPQMYMMTRAARLGRHSPAISDRWSSWGREWQSQRPWFVRPSAPFDPNINYERGTVTPKCVRVNISSI